MKPGSARRTRSPAVGPRRGTRPAAPKDQRTASTYIFGAICPRPGKGAGLVLPRCNIVTMNLHRAKIATAVAPGAHAVLLIDQAGWHLSDRQQVPANITLMPLPAKCPELNPVENVWQFIRDNWLSNRVSAPSATLSITAAMPGISSPISPGASCQSVCATGQTGSEHQALVLGPNLVSRIASASHDPHRKTGCFPPIVSKSPAETPEGYFHARS
jgi:hypothetical protein